MKPPLLILYLLLFITTSKLAQAQQNDSTAENKQSLIGGFRFQKVAGFYWINGLSIEYNTSKIWNQKISFGLNVVSSKLGSAAFSNAIPYYEINFSAIKYFRNEKKLKPSKS